MRDNTLTIRINEPVHEVFVFTITPPNSTLWIPSVISEETNQWPVQIGTVYTLRYKGGITSKVCVVNILEDTLVEWVSNDNTYHCRYTFKAIDENISELEYNEWTDKEELKNPFVQEDLEKLKRVIEQ